MELAFFVEGWVESWVCWGGERKRLAFVGSCGMYPLRDVMDD